MHGEPRKLLERLRSLHRLEILSIGNITFGALSYWNDHVTTEMIITGERRHHYLERHPEMLEDESLLVVALTAPSEIHRNTLDERIAIIYQPIDDRYFLRIPIWVSNRSGMINSVLSVRRASVDEIMKGRFDGRLVWKK